MALGINVVDSIMGAGKTSWAIQYMNERPGPFLYVTPYLDEVQRIIDSCPEQEFVQPEALTGWNEDAKDTRTSKLNGLKALLEEGQNIASTHALFRILDEEATEMIRLHGYTLIMDEVLDVLNVIGVKDEKPSTLIAHGIVVPETDPKNPNVVRLVPGPEDGLKKYDEVRKYAKDGRLVLVYDTMLLWLFPVDVFAAFKEVFNLTYLFDGQFQRAYYDFHSLEYVSWSVIDTGNRNYTLVPHNPEFDRVTIEKAKSLISIHEGPRNDVGESQTALSKSWWLYRKDRGEKRKVMNVTRSWLKKVCKATRSTAMWTTFKDVYRDGLGYYPESFQYGCFVPQNQRATNAHRGRRHVAYLVNVFFKPSFTTFFEAVGVKLDEELFAVSELIQFVWRSAIRDGKPIDLFIPSKRMRRILNDWLNCSLGDLEEPVMVKKAA